jgi:alpha-D-xyloside xylohydrolase
VRFHREGKRLVAEGGGELIWIEPFGRDCLRFRSSLRGRIEPLDWTLLPQNEVKPEITITPEKATIRNGNITAEIDARGSVRYKGQERAGAP